MRVSDKPEHRNRLADEASPYLLQHAHNPVDWYPWGAEALERARREDKPILLSIGYAACHWCHVMERESFEDEAIARAMNERFVCIKVDREERPDLDQIYQLVVQLMGRSGGWPLTVFLTPDQHPFFAGTYFPPRERHGMPGFPRVLEALAAAYADKRGEVEAQAQELAHAIARVHRIPEAGEGPGPDLLRRASRRLLARFDDRFGGFGNRPKFPNTMGVDVLLRRGVLEGDEPCATAVKKALDGMRAGGIYDQLRGGFARYSTDEKWLVPHFEKMLYDNALLLRLYVDGWRAFGDARYAGTARGIVGWLCAEMRDTSGAFYASQDADSEGQEGKFFVWTPADLAAALGDDTEARDVAAAHFGIDDEGNFEHTGATVLSEARPLATVAARLDRSVDACCAALERARTAMLAHRSRRVPPPTDTKVLASWNGLAIAALADAGRALGEPTWVEAAERALEAIEARLVEGGRVRRFFKGDQVGRGTAWGFVDDHAYLGCAALELYEATGNPRWAALAREIADAMLAHHWDPVEPGFFVTPDDGERLIARSKDVFDQAIPSGNAKALELCLRLGELIDERYAETAERGLEALAGAAAEDAFALGATVAVLDRLARGSVQVVVVGDASSPAARALTDRAFAAYLPDRTVAVVDPARPETQAAAALVAEGKAAVGGAPAIAYVCRGRTCSAPVGSAEELAVLLAPPAA